jgi:DNA-binding response OmpR family regulator
VSASRVLVIEDSEAIRLPVATALSALGYEVEAWRDGAALSERLGPVAPDVVILDVMLPGRDGFQLLQEIRRTSTAAVIMLTARDTTADRVRGLTGGADDYLVKPFAMAELVARVQAVLRRVGRGGGATAVGDLVISQDLSVITRDGRELELTDTERRLLGYLAAHRDRVVSKTQILTAVWGYGGFDDNLVEVNISALRRKIESEGGARLLHTVRGRGYVLGPER